MRLFLRSQEEAGTAFVIQLVEVAAFFDSLERDTRVRITDSPDHGSFGWWLPAEDSHHSVRLSGVGDGTGLFLALARRVEYRTASDDEAINWPG